MASAKELATAYVQIIPSMKGSTGKIKTEITGDMEDAGEKTGDSFGKKFVDFAKKVIVAAGIGKIITQSIAEGAKIEQSFGGLKTMFKENYDLIAGYAQDAWKTAGMSANKYAEQATLFSATLLKSVGGNTKKAAELANMALMDMGDNINKFGGDMAMVENAYQGLARGSYVMLDNLRLGYKGTANEMMRLINDSGVLGYKLTDVAQLSKVGFATMVEAIHKVQSEMGITGTTIAEASHTISGSLNQMKGAFSNVLATISMVGKEGMEILDFEKSLSNLIESVASFAANIVPALVSVLTTLPTALTTIINYLIPVLIKEGPVLIKGLATGLLSGIPLLLQTMTRLVKVMSSGISKKVPEFVKQAIPMITGFAKTLVDNVWELTDAAIMLMIGLQKGIMDSLPQIIEAGAALIVNLVLGLLDKLPYLVSYVPRIVETVVTGVVDNLPQIIEAGFKVIPALIEGIVKAIPELLKAAGDLVTRIWNEIVNTDWIQLGKDIISGIVKGITKKTDSAVDAAKNVAKKTFTGVATFFGIKSPSKLMEKEIGRFIPQGIAVGITANTKSVTRAMDDISNMTLGSAENMIGRSRISSDFGNDNLSTTNYGGFNFNIYAKDNQSAKEIAEEVENMIMNKINAGRKVFA